jgi:glutathione-regulated potassium-efflux system ancillary protein KefF
MSRAVLVYAHPYPDRSRANRVLYDAVRSLHGVDARAIYDRYPDFWIDVEAEQAALLAADLVIWQHPVYWYSVPALLKLWWEKVLAHGWAYGAGGTALVGKRCLWVPTTGGDLQAYSDSGMHAHPFSHYEPVVRQTARFCGMRWEEPLVLHGAHRISEPDLFAFAGRYRARVMSLLGLEAPPTGAR